MNWPKYGGKKTKHLQNTNQKYSLQIPLCLAGEALI
jgi:hypothetical protein